MSAPEPNRVRLVHDYLDFKTGIAYEVGTVLIRSPHGTGQYMTEGTKLGQGGCIAYFDLIKDIAEEIKDE
jgi:hypothetical protein